MTEPISFEDLDARIYRLKPAAKNASILNRLVDTTLSTFVFLLLAFLASILSTLMINSESLFLVFLGFSIFFMSPILTMFYVYRLFTLWSS